MNAPRYQIVDFDRISPTPCPCGAARRAFADRPDYPATVHRTEISVDAKPHYHRRLTETYYILDCDGDARMQLDDETGADPARHVHPDSARHRPSRRRPDDGADLRGAQVRSGGRGRGKRNA